MHPRSGPRQEFAKQYPQLSRVPLILRKEVKCKVGNSCKLLCGLWNSSEVTGFFQILLPETDKNHKSKIWEQILSTENKSCCQHPANWKII